jgi:hypothetical protein
MPAGRLFEAAFKQLHETFIAKAKRAFLDDLRGQIEEDERVQEILQKRPTKERYLAVTFDRRKNDTITLRPWRAS